MLIYCKVLYTVPENASNVLWPQETLYYSCQLLKVFHILQHHLLTHLKKQHRSTENPIPIFIQLTHHSTVNSIMRLGSSIFLRQGQSWGRNWIYEFLNQFPCLTYLKRHREILNMNACVLIRGVDLRHVTWA